MRLATCTYQEFTADMGVPVRTTVGYPRFKLAAAPAGHARLITPANWMLKAGYATYADAYRRRLDDAGVDAIRTELEQIPAEGENTRRVLLCFERLTKPGVWCHRTMFAAWWQEHTGEEVPELGALPQPGPPTLFDL
ncbi:hypothetical protein [Streptomonospora litoralis]|uniref:DUF488 domain-containing protein n=1 Tax=Streptomonospora litoralis TaxID=2498135 RepID=A0A4V0ZKF6_9ACTN|nr:hypothetical protein [Streptomonospora litoralis]QBI56812.1 hypothetical protein EKD16_25360 [Streptomonospora litoralis]